MLRFKEEILKIYGETFSLIEDVSNSINYNTLEDVFGIYSLRYNIYAGNPYNLSKCATLRLLEC